MAGIYLHIPFCASRCIYCGFFSSTARERMSPYVDALCREMALRHDYLPEGMPIDTIYLGGGTPSQLPRELLEKIFCHLYHIYKVETDAEITLECNPDDVTPAFAEGLRSLPINRVSMGAQTFSDARLRFLRRRHIANQVGEAVERLRQAGIQNISIDLMFGFPDESLEDWRDDLRRAIALRVEHLSAYSLMYEEETPLHRLLRQGKIREISEETSLSMYETLIDMMTQAGFEHYEISNFARPGYRSRHNSSYWKAIPYIGLGAAAHSYDLCSRQWNVSDLEAYIKAIGRGEIPAEREILDEATRYDDLITTALRTREGIRPDDLPLKYRNYLLANARPYLDRHLLKQENGRLHLTREGLFISDSIMADLMYV